MAETLALSGSPFTGARVEGPDRNGGSIPAAHAQKAAVLPLLLEPLDLRARNSPYQREDFQSTIMIDRELAEVDPYQFRS